MPRLSKRPRSKGFFRTSKNSIVLEFVTLTAKSKIPLAQPIEPKSFSKPSKTFIARQNSRHIAKQVVSKLER